MTVRWYSSGNWIPPQDIEFANLTSLKPAADARSLSIVQIPDVTGENLLAVIEVEEGQLNVFQGNKNASFINGVNAPGAENPYWTWKNITNLLYVNNTSSVPARLYASFTAAIDYSDMFYNPGEVLPLPNVVIAACLKDDRGGLSAGNDYNSSMYLANYANGSFSKLKKVRIITLSLSFPQPSVPNCPYLQVGTIHQSSTAEAI